MSDTDHDLGGALFQIAEPEAPQARRRQAGLDTIGIPRGQPLVFEFRLQNDARRFVLAAIAAPHGRLHPALAHHLGRKVTLGGGFHQLQRPIEIGFPGAVLADENRHLSEIEPDGPQRAIAFG